MTHWLHLFFCILKRTFVYVLVHMYRFFFVCGQPNFIQILYCVHFFFYVWHSYAIYLFHFFIYRISSKAGFTLLRIGCRFPCICIAGDCDQLPMELVHTSPQCLQCESHRSPVCIYWGRSGLLLWVAVFPSVNPA